MAQDIQTFDVTVQPGVAKATPALTTIELGIRRVLEIHVEVPPGPRGEVGFWLGSAGVQIIPKNLGQFIVTDNQHVVLPIDGFFDSGSWTVAMYNTGHYAHTFQYTFLSDFVIGFSGPSVGAPIPASELTTG